MPPLPKEVVPTGALAEGDEIDTDTIPQNMYIPDERPVRIVYRNIVNFAILHLVALYGLFLALTSAKWPTLILAFFLYNVGTFGVTGGAHRLWSHKSYKAKWPLKLILVICQTVAHQNSVIEWARDHRLHHKYQETDADPHNSKRGFVFAHMGWLCSKKHEQVKIKGKALDFSDLHDDTLLKFQHKHFMILMPLACFILPTVTPMLLWNETFINSFSVNILRYVLGLHALWSVNSVAHRWGYKPFDKNINPTESSWVSLFAAGEGWHNYHHTFPWDYKASELGRLNLAMLLINLFAKIGWAYDLKSVSKEIVQYKVMKSGDGSHNAHNIWGWGDKDQTKENYEAATIYNQKNA